jgi:hypothetical protein
LFNFRESLFTVFLDPGIFANLFEGAAKQGHLESQLNMGFLFSHGRGVDQSFERAVYW